MARVAAHLKVSELEQGYRGAKQATTARHFQAIWLMAKGHTIPQVSALTSFGTRWLERLLARYNADGPAALGDRRQHNGRAATILKPELLAELRRRLEAQRGWEALKALDWSLQVPRPQHPEAATPEEREGFKKAWPRGRRGSPAPAAHAGRGLRRRTSTGSA